MAAIFYYPVALTSDNIHKSPIVFLDPDNVGVAFGISLSSHTEAEINDIAYVLQVLPVNGGHLRLTSHPDVGKYTHLFHRVARPRQYGVAVGISLSSHTEAEINDIAYVLQVLPVNGGHLRFTSHPDVGEYSHQFHRVARPRQYGVAAGILLLSYIQAKIYDIAYVLSVNGRHL